MTWPFGHLTPLKYGAILADPPWSYAMRSAKGYAKAPEAHYATMSHEDIKALPVAQLAAGDCLLFMWSTWPHLDQAQAVLKAWGFTYKTGGAWFKKTVTGKSAFGTGYILRSSCEPYLIGTIGRPDIRSRSVRNEIIAPASYPPGFAGGTPALAPEGGVCLPEAPDPDAHDASLTAFPDTIEGLRREHSRKPPEARAILDTLLPHTFKAELFAREPWAGADVWGNEVGKLVKTGGE